MKGRASWWMGKGTEASFLSFLLSGVAACFQLLSPHARPRRRPMASRSTSCGGLNCSMAGRSRALGTAEEGGGGGGGEVFVSVASDCKTNKKEL